ncbi:MAG: xanthine dehydrogenase family protein subunit M [Gammaproteobacteria bacterium]|jgi:carbon-monoxide dehydrogenase medium subunit|nr:xanthine dehydrogenase family protein subunit M [Gammaproteobacteria bacterium]MDH3909183.1 xanthine dehydrogenase family protein subunit M [Gammaproteobacteria bacterium]MDH3954257.1 xanthine dehydrogenase family protein subunit M [Gammaproteobacteria bacterium]MDH4005832.1 xanthine dehydrogenase family protein subunit M [Gammaproteobacteria bacterium]NCF58631.1 carbon monoxide dehydrogenase [Gammaproteobacteria bacterium]
MYEFNYHRPASLDEAKQILAANAEAKIIAGGMTLLPTMKLRLAQPSDLVDLSAIDGLDAISDAGSAIDIGAMARHADVAHSEVVRSAIPALADLADAIGDAQVRNRGTLGGSIANSDPAADYPAAILALNATIRTDQREIAADDYFLGMFETALADDELVVAVSFPKPKKAAYAKFHNPASRYAIVGVMVAETDSGIRVAVTGAGACAFRASDFEAALTESFSADALGSVSIDSDDLNSDLHASAGYRAHLVRVMAVRAVKALGG